MRVLAAPGGAIAVPLPDWHDQLSKDPSHKAHHLTDVFLELR